MVCLTGFYAGKRKIFYPFEWFFIHIRNMEFWSNFWRARTLFIYKWATLSTATSTFPENIFFGKGLKEDTNPSKCPLGYLLVGLLDTVWPAKPKTTSAILWKTTREKKAMIELDSRKESVSFDFYDWSQAILVNMTNHCVERS